MVPHRLLFKICPQRSSLPISPPLTPLLLFIVFFIMTFLVQGRTMIKVFQLFSKVMCIGSFSLCLSWGSPLDPWDPEERSSPAPSQNLFFKTFKTSLFSNLDSSSPPPLDTQPILGLSPLKAPKGLPSPDGSRKRRHSTSSNEETESSDDDTGLFDMQTFVHQLCASDLGTKAPPSSPGPFTSAKRHPQNFGPYEPCLLSLALSLELTQKETKAS